MKFLLMIFMTMSLVACSGSKLANQAESALEDAESELSDNVEGAIDDAEEQIGDELGFGDEEEGEGEEGEGEEEPEVAEGDDDTETEDISPDQVAGSPAPSMEMTGSDGWYTVQSGDTLMIIAFKIYGDYDRWRSLASWNSGRLGPNYSVSVGQKIKYDEPAEKFEWNPSGNPYLIRSGDTLGTISSSTYGTPSYWRNIWKNNTPLIKDPNRIFAGFTIYTPIIGGRDVANESEDE